MFFEGCLSLVAICEVDETLILHQGLFVRFRPSI